MNSDIIKTVLSIVTQISDNSDIGAVRRLAVAYCRSLNFAPNIIEKIAIIATELVSNLIKHANKRNAQLIMQIFEAHGSYVFEILALDKGPGMYNIPQCLQDGYSTAKSSGTGLGAIVRLADLMDIYSQKDVGTLILARVMSHPTTVPLSSLFEVGSLSTPYPGEEKCGDSWSIFQTEERSVFLMVDGLGHGFNAAEAANQACALFQQHKHLQLTELVRTISQGLRTTRGAALAVAEINRTEQIIKYVGVGNISSRVIINNKAHHMVNYDGIAGGGYHSVREFVYPWDPQAILIMHSDGIVSRWDINHLPGLLFRDPTIIAGMIYSEFNRGYDDSSIMVVKQNPHL